MVDFGHGVNLEQVAQDHMIYESEQFPAGILKLEELPAARAGAPRRSREIWLIRWIGVRAPQKEEPSEPKGEDVAKIFTEVTTVAEQRIKEKFPRGEKE